MDFNFGEGTFVKAFQDMMSGTFTIEYPSQAFEPIPGISFYQQLGPQLKFSGIRVQDIGQVAFELHKMHNSLLRARNEIEHRINFLEQTEKTDQSSEANAYKECLTLIDRALKNEQ